MERRKSFFKGALTGALTMSVIFLIVIASGFGKTEGKTESKEKELVSQETQKKMKSIDELIEQAYLYNDDIDKAELQKWLIKGYVQGLGDPYSVYYDEAETQSLMESTSGEFGGIGVVIQQDIDTMVMTFTNVYAESPGEKAGLKDGDVLYKVDGEDVTGQELDTVVSKIRGQKGTKVEITVYRKNTMEEYSCTVTRDIIEVTTVAYEMKEDNIGYIIVSGFEQVTYKQFEDAIKNLNEQGMEKMIVDLRDNPGGNLSTVCEMLDLILPEGTIVYTEDKNNVREVFTSDDQKQIQIPMAVLINGNSASASEIFAGAIQDYEMGTLVGTTTYGKGIVQNIYSLGDGTSLKLTTSEYFTPNGRNIHGIGIKPDIEVKYEYDEANPTADNQLQAAIKHLKELKK